MDQRIKDKRENVALGSLKPTTNRGTGAGGKIVKGFEIQIYILRHIGILGL